MATVWFVFVFVFTLIALRYTSAEVSL